MFLFWCYVIALNFESVTEWFMWWWGYNLSPSGVRIELRQVVARAAGQALRDLPFPSRTAAHRVLSTTLEGTSLLVLPFCQ